MPHWYFGFSCWFMNVSTGKEFHATCITRTFECRIKCIDLFWLCWMSNLNAGFWILFWLCYTGQVFSFDAWLIPHWPIPSKDGKLPLNQDPLRYLKFFGPVVSYWLSGRICTATTILHIVRESITEQLPHTRQLQSRVTFSFILFYFLLGPKVMSFMGFMWFIKYKVMFVLYCLKKQLLNNKLSN